MAQLTVQTPTAVGIEPTTGTQLAAWSDPDTISSSEIGERGVIVLADNATAGSLDLRVGDPGTTPAGNSAANGYATVTVPAGEQRWVFVGKHNVDTSTGFAEVGASSTDAAFTVQVLRY